MADTSVKNDMWQLLHKSELGSICPKSDKLIVVKSSDSIEHVVKVLSDHKILSAPVVDKTNNCLGLIDMLDIVSFILSVAPDRTSIERDALQSLEICGRAMALESVKNVMDFSKRDPYVPVYCHNPITQATNLFATKHIHRLPLVEKDGKVVHTVSQSDVTRFITEHIKQGKLKIFGELTIAEMGLGKTGSVVSVKQDATVLVALKKMDEHKISAVAVVDEHGKLEGNFSGSDLRGLFTEKFPSLLLSVQEYLTKYSEMSLSPVCVKASTKFGDLLSEFATSKVHRLWVIDDNYKPKGIISLTDVMKAVEDFHLTDDIAKKHK